MGSGRRLRLPVYQGCCSDRSWEGRSLRGQTLCTFSAQVSKVKMENSGKCEGKREGGPVSPSSEPTTGSCSPRPRKERSRTHFSPRHFCGRRHGPASPSFPLWPFMGDREINAKNLQCLATWPLNSELFSLERQSHRRCVLPRKQK